MPGARLADLAPPQRLAVGLFLALVLGFYVLAQVKLSLSAGGAAPPGPVAILRKYHGDPTQSRLHFVLDPELPAENDLHMYTHLGAPDERDERRRRILDWVERGAPEDDWLRVAPVFQAEETCGQCHSRRPAPDGEPRLQHDVPFDTWEDVLPLARPARGMSADALATSAHNHLMGFAVVSLLVSLVYSASRRRGLWLFAPIVLAFAGSALDVGSWWLTRAYGSPFEWGVILGGGSFGAAVLWMTVLSLDELWAGGRIGRILDRLGRARETPLGPGEGVA
jgi:hypothetical protein